jgi:hypothetical protein
MLEFIAILTVQRITAAYLNQINRRAAGHHAPGARQPDQATADFPQLPARRKIDPGKKPAAVNPTAPDGQRMA